MGVQAGIGPGHVRAFLGVDLVERMVHGDIEADVIEDEELRFRTEVGGVTDAGTLQIGFGPPCHRARVAAVGLAGARFEDIAEQN